MSVVCCRNRSVNLAAWAERNGVARVSAYRWFALEFCRCLPGEWVG